MGQTEIMSAYKEPALLMGQTLMAWAREVGEGRVGGEKHHVMECSAGLWDIVLSMSCVERLSPTALRHS